MSLPKRAIHADDIKFPVNPTKPDMAVRKTLVALQNLERIALQLSQLSQYSNELFEDLIKHTVEISTRIQKSHERLCLVQKRTISDLPNILVAQELVTDRVEWKLPAKLYCNFFVPETENASVLMVYGRCNAAPRLQDLDEYRTDGKSSLSFYTYPRFFAEEWKRLVMKEDEERRQRRRNKKKTRATRTVSELIVKKYNSEGVLLSSDSKSAEDPHTRVPGIQGNQPHTLSRNAVVKSLLSITVPPPPPTLPPPVLIASSNDKLTSRSESMGSQRAGLMSDIASGQFKLKKTDSPSNESLLRAGSSSNSNEVAAILMRRAALEMSDDSDDEDEDDEDWE